MPGDAAVELQIRVGRIEVHGPHQPPAAQIEPAAHRLGAARNEAVVRDEPGPGVQEERIPGAEQDLVAGGGVVVDARHVVDFAAGHIPGSLSIELRPVFASWLGWLTDLEQPVAFVERLGADVVPALAGL